MLPGSVVDGSLQAGDGRVEVAGIQLDAAECRERRDVGAPAAKNLAVVELGVGRAAAGLQHPGEHQVGLGAVGRDLDALLRRGEGPRTVAKLKLSPRLGKEGIGTGAARRERRQRGGVPAVEFLHARRIPCVLLDNPAACDKRRGGEFGQFGVG